MESELTQLMIGLWGSACQDRPQRPSCTVDEHGNFVMTITGNRERWGAMLKAAGVPSHAHTFVDEYPDLVRCTWPSIADQIFGEEGLIAQHLPNYEMRAPQLHMARMIQRSIEMNQPACIEAGTGTGKSLAYAAVAMAMNKKVVISTSNKALQMQLYKKDIPFLQTIFAGKKMALVQGKQNYACKAKTEDTGSGTYAVSGELLEWYLQTETGNTEEIPFAVDYQELGKMTVDRYCPGKMCHAYETCFYYEAKRKRQDADVLICNHALLALHQLFPGAGILPPVDVIVVDEAHKFADYVRHAIGSEFELDTIKKRISLAEKYEVTTSMATEAMHSFFREVRDLVAQSRDREVGVEKGWEFYGATSLAVELYLCAEEIWHDGDMPSDRNDKRRQADATVIRNLADHLAIFSQATRDGFVRWIEINDGAYKCFHVPHDVADFISRMAGFAPAAEVPSEDHTPYGGGAHCARCGRRLTAETVNVLEGLPYGPDCIRYADLMGDAEQIALSEWLSRDHVPAEPIHQTPTPVIFTSATLAAPDMSSFMREAGLPWAFQMIASSPFDYERNSLLYIPPAACPAPDKPDYKEWLVEEMARLVHASQGGAFLLFTSYANMRFVSERLHYEFTRTGYEIFVQGKLPKLEIIKRFIAAGNGVLFATKSFWEGVSIDGSALRLVAIDKMPFEAPSPLNQAQEAALRTWAREVQGMTDKEAEWYPFEALRVPRMTIDLKQGAGRLIRTQSDWGVIAILDARLRSAQYARRLVLPALPPARRVAMLWEVEEFLLDKIGSERVKAGDLTPVEQFGIQAGHMVGKIPF